jgi:hypothetical protein
LIYPKFNNSSDIKGDDMSNNIPINHVNTDVRSDSVISYDVNKPATLVGQLEKELQNAVDSYRSQLLKNMTENIIKKPEEESSVNRTLRETVDKIGSAATEGVKENNPGILSSALSALGGLFGLGGSGKKDQDESDDEDYDTPSPKKYLHTLNTDRDNFIIISTMILKSLSASIDGKPLPPRFYNDLNYLIGNPFIPTPAAGLTPAVANNLGYSSKGIMFTSFRRALNWVGSAFDRLLKRKMAYKNDVDTLSAAYDDSMSLDLDRFDFDLDNFGGLNNHE